MLRSLWQLTRTTLEATDGDIGLVRDVYFEDESWTVRYVVVDTGYWLPGRRVLISPHSFPETGPMPERLSVDLTREQVRDSPAIDTAKPVSRQHEIELSRHYGFLPYWEGPYRWGKTPYPARRARSGEGSPNLPHEPRSTVTERETMRRDQPHLDPRLRSAQNVVGYRIEASDGEIGHVDDLIFDDREWVIRYMVVDTRNWRPGKRVLISPEWIEKLSHPESSVQVNVTRAAVRDAPEYTRGDLLDREREAVIHKHYGKHGYWERGPEAWVLFASPPAP